MSNLIAIAETRRAEANRHLLHRAEKAKESLNGFMPLGSVYDPGGSIAKQRQANRQAVMEEIKMIEAEVKRNDALTGDALVKVFVPEASSANEPSPTVAAQGFSGSVVSATGQVMPAAKTRVDTGHTSFALFGGE